MVNILKKILYFLAILCIAICASSLAYAEDQYSFGPKNLTINLWHFHLSFHKVTVDDPGEGILNITKNSPDKKIKE